MSRTPQDSPPERPVKISSSESFWGRGGAWVLAQFLIMPAWLIFAPLDGKLTSSWALLSIGVVFIGAGAAAGIAGVIALKRSRTPFPKPLPDSTLIRTGVYSIVRHPLYASLIFLGFGWAALWQSAGGALLAGLQALLLDAKARREEHWLREKFPGYAQYASEVRRLIPGLY